MRESFGAVAPLVSTTKSPSPCFEEIGVAVEKTGEKGLLPQPNEDQRFLRYEMQSAAKYMLPKHRVGICLRHQIDKYGGVDLFKHRSTQKAFYGGLMICGNVWVCPVCAAKISERRRKELKTAFKGHLNNDGYCTMLTLTFSHSARDKLDDLLDALSKAMSQFRSGKRYDNYRKRIGLIGSIRAFEITYGRNGWHPHIHLLNLHTSEIEEWEWDDLRYDLYEMWSSACEKNGLTCSFEHGLKMTDAEEASTYIGKWGDVMDKPWGTDSEMTKANVKKGRDGGMTPFDFLRAIVEDGDLEYREKFQEYANAVKGKRQLVWSPGLKDKFLIEDKSDEEVATEKVEQADLLGVLGWKDWRYILHNGLRATLLKNVEMYGYQKGLESIGLQIKEPTDKITDEQPFGRGL
jgi:hypothetical protein